MKRLIKKIEQWAKDRNLLTTNNQDKQYIKVVEELGELGKGLLENNKPLIIDSIGDVLITLILLSKQLDLDIVYCLEMAYNEIKDRKGKTINGTFIKDK